MTSCATELTPSNMTIASSHSKTYVFVDADVPVEARKGAVVKKDNSSNSSVVSSEAYDDDLDTTSMAVNHLQNGTLVGCVVEFPIADGWNFLNVPDSVEKKKIHGCVTGSTTDGSDWSIVDMDIPQKEEGSVNKDWLWQLEGSHKCAKPNFVASTVGNDSVAAGNQFDVDQERNKNIISVLSDNAPDAKEAEILKHSGSLSFAEGSSTTVNGIKPVSDGYVKPIGCNSSSTCRDDCSQVFSSPWQFSFDLTNVINGIASTSKAATSGVDLVREGGVL